jgi:hypothetical protein
MVRKNQTQTLIVLAVAALIGVALYFLVFKKDHKKIAPLPHPQQPPSKYAPQPEPHKEGFTSLAAGAVDNVGALLDDQYDLIVAPDAQVPGPHFADMVSEGGDHLKQYIEQPAKTGESMRPMERLQRIQGDRLMPRVSTSVTPFNVDVANPSSHKYMVNTPRVTSALKSRFKDYSLANMMRGDVLINYHPNVPLIAKTFQGRDDLRLDGLFTPHFTALYNKYTGRAYRGLVQKVAGAGSAGGYGGASGEIVMDGY